MRREKIHPRKIDLSKVEHYGLLGLSNYHIAILLGVNLTKLNESPNDVDAWLAAVRRGKNKGVDMMLANLRQTAQEGDRTAIRFLQEYVGEK